MFSKIYISHQPVETSFLHFYTKQQSVHSYTTIHYKVLILSLTFLFLLFHLVGMLWKHQFTKLKLFGYHLKHDYIKERKILYRDIKKIIMKIIYCLTEYSNCFFLYQFFFKQLQTFETNCQFIFHSLFIVCTYMVFSFELVCK